MGWMEDGAVQGRPPNPESRLLWDPQIPQNPRGCHGETEARQENGEQLTEPTFPSAHRWWRMSGVTARRQTTRRRRRRWPRTGPSPMATLSSTTTTAKATERPGPESCHFLPPAPAPPAAPHRDPGAPAGPRPSGAGPQLCLTLTAGALPPLTCCLNPLRFPGTGGDPHRDGSHPTGGGSFPPRSPSDWLWPKELGPSPLLGSYSNFSQPFLHRGEGEKPLSLTCVRLEKPAQPLLH